MRILLEPSLVLFFVLGLAALYIVGWLLLFPLRKLLKLTLNSIFGAVILAVINLFGAGIEINAFSSIAVGLLGIPGIVLLFILKFV